MEWEEKCSRSQGLIIWFDSPRRHRGRRETQSFNLRVT
jgi:hypothetical protein